MQSQERKLLEPARTPDSKHDRLAERLERIEMGLTALLTVVAEEPKLKPRLLRVLDRPAEFGKTPDRAFAKKLKDLVKKRTAA